MKDSNRKAMFASSYNKKSREQKERLLNNAGAWTNAKFHSLKSFDDLGQTEKDLLLKKQGFNINRKVKYPYKLKSKNDKRQQNEPETHYLERTGQILSSRVWSQKKKHMVHHRTGQDYHE